MRAAGTIDTFFKDQTRAILGSSRAINDMRERVRSNNVSAREFRAVYVVFVGIEPKGVKTNEL